MAKSPGANAAGGMAEGRLGGRLATFVDARTHGVAELMQYAREAAREGVFLVIVGGSKVSTHDLVQITSAGQGFVSFQLEPPESPGAL